MVRTRFYAAVIVIFLSISINAKEILFVWGVFDADHGQDLEGIYESPQSTMYYFCNISLSP